MLNFKKGLLTSILALMAIGCSEPVPEVPSTADTNSEIKTERQSSVSAPVDQGAVMAAQGENWQYVLKNAVRTADEYAVKNNPRASFLGSDMQTSLVKQYDGDYEGEYLLTILNDSPNNISYAQLHPLFDVNESSDELDDESQLWEVTVAKYNGKEF